MKPLGAAPRTFQLLALGIVWFLMSAIGGGPWEQAILHRANLADQPELRAAAVLLTDFGAWPILAGLSVAGAIFLLFKGRRMDAILLLFTIIVGRLLVDLQKLAIGRARPDEALRLVDVGSFSFPSGHAANSMITYVALAILLTVAPRPRLIATSVAVAMSIAIGASRIMLGVHWPTDVLGGWTFGLFWTVLVMWIARRTAGPNLGNLPNA